MEYPRSVTELTESLRQGGYLADRGLATTLLVSLSLRRPVLLEGEVGVGKTEVAKTLAEHNRNVTQYRHGISIDSVAEGTARLFGEGQGARAVP